MDKQNLSEQQSEELETVSEQTENLEAVSDESQNKSEPFTRGPWYGGIIGFSSAYILIGFFGMLNDKFSLGFDNVIHNSTFHYIFSISMLIICGAVGKVIQDRINKKNK